ncbi:hypothetical protein P8T57_06220 [Thalassospira sp. SN3W]|uniref:hypothetical protein n=1 Tax=Thalassospira sp. SN3W TaxID=3035476 RepID=UPI00311AF93A
MGPTLVFDKSVIECLSERESRWLTNLYALNRVPTLFMEILANLKKDWRDGRAPEGHVQGLANKIPQIDVWQNLHHREIWYHNLLGYEVPMDGHVLVPRGERIVDATGAEANFLGRSPEDKAMSRWVEGRFNEFEGVLAQRWRDAIKLIDLVELGKSYRKVYPKWREVAPDLSSIQDVVAKISSGRTGNFELLRQIINTLEPGDIEYEKNVIRNWRMNGRPKIIEYAPYAVHCFSVNIFFSIGIASDTLSTRPTNLIDLQYLYYLPFCKVFVSGDRFHQSLVPFFLRDGQVFLEAEHLKQDLREIADAWDTNQDGTSGTMSFVRHPLPNSYSEKVWDTCWPDWRKQFVDEEMPSTEEQRKKTYARLRPMLDAIETHTVAKQGHPSQWDALLNPDPKDHF